MEQTNEGEAQDPSRIFGNIAEGDYITLLKVKKDASESGGTRTTLTIRALYGVIPEFEFQNVEGLLEAIKGHDLIHVKEIRGSGGEKVP